MLGETDVIAGVLCMAVTVLWLMYRMWPDTDCLTTAQHGSLAQKGANAIRHRQEALRHDVCKTSRSHSNFYVMSSLKRDAV